ncbi:unnamed protein product [Paramecium sonneborni]|uniref:Uncharacterized protein n=1 Tax=Paramecium sonneborni TaxID=65129 RepID=A0A8S1KQW3_9CILI|nr:unnamed protein product [Paramecium sonneborni]
MRSSLALRLRNSIDNTQIQYDNKYSVHVNTQQPVLSPRKSVDKTTIHQIYKVTQPQQIKNKTIQLNRDVYGYNFKYNNSVDVSLEELKKIKTLEKSLYCIQDNRKIVNNKMTNQKQQVLQIQLIFFLGSFLNQQQLRKITEKIFSSYFKLEIISLTQQSRKDQNSYVTINF